MKEPLYSIIASRVEDLIRSGEWSVGQRLPAERELCRLMDVSRATLRQALAELEERGLINRHQGRGTNVAGAHVDADVSGSFTLAAALRRRGLHLRTQVVSVGVVEASRRLADDLACHVGNHLVRLVRVRALDAEPVLLEQAHLPLARFPGLAERSFADRSLYDILRTDYGCIASVATESLEPVCATAAEAHALGLPRRAPLLLIRRITTDQTGTPVETNHALLRGDRCRFLLTRRIGEGPLGVIDVAGLIAGGDGSRATRQHATTSSVDRRHVRQGANHRARGSVDQ